MPTNKVLLTEYAVKGTRIPNVDFDIGESYAGLMPIDKKKTLQNTLYFWFFPVATKEFKEKKEIVIWLNGGVSFLVPIRISSQSANSFSSPAARHSLVSLKKTAPSYGSLAWPSHERTLGLSIS